MNIQKELTKIAKLITALYAPRSIISFANDFASLCMKNSFDGRLPNKGKIVKYQKIFFTQIKSSVEDLKEDEVGVTKELLLEHIDDMFYTIYSKKIDMYDAISDAKYSLNDYTDYKPDVEASEDLTFLQDMIDLVQEIQINGKRLSNIESKGKGILLTLKRYSKGDPLYATAGVDYLEELAKYSGLLLACSESLKKVEL